jgi:hypothetical protein
VASERVASDPVAGFSRLPAECVIVSQSSDSLEARSEAGKHQSVSSFHCVKCRQLDGRGRLEPGEEEPEDVWASGAGALAVPVLAPGLLVQLVGLLEALRAGERAD